MFSSMFVSAFACTNAYPHLTTSDIQCLLYTQQAFNGSWEDKGDRFFLNSEGLREVATHFTKTKYIAVPFLTSD